MLEKIHPEKSSQKPVKLVNDVNNNTYFLFACGILYKKKRCTFVSFLGGKACKGRKHT